MGSAVTILYHQFEKRLPLVDEQLGPTWLLTQLALNRSLYRILNLQLLCVLTFCLYNTGVIFTKDILEENEGKPLFQNCLRSKLCKEVNFST